MRSTKLLVMVAALGGIFASVSAYAGGPSPSERRYLIGRCPGDVACTWSCDEADNPRCAAAENSCDLPAPNFAARVRVTVDDQNCPAPAGGGRLTIGVAGQRIDGGQFTVPDTTIDLCGATLDQLECGGDLGVCPDVTVPRSVVFLCATNLANGFGGVFDEQDVPDVFWMTNSTFHPSIAEAIKAAFPGVIGEPLVLTTTEASFDDQQQTAAPSTREVCITGTFVTPRQTLEAPPAVLQAAVTTVPSTVSLGDCPTLPIVTTTTTLPVDPCGGLASDRAVGCLVDRGVAACPAEGVPAVVTRARDRAMALVARGVEAAKPRKRAARFTAARQKLLMARRKVAKIRRLDADCRAALVAALDAASAFVNSLRE